MDTVVQKMITNQMINLSLASWCTCLAMAGTIKVLASLAVAREGLQVARCDVESPTQRFQFQYNSPV